MNQNKIFFQKLVYLGLKFKDDSVHFDYQIYMF